MLVLLYRCTTWTLTKWKERKLDGNCTIMLRIVLNKFWRQHPTKQHLYGHLPPISKTIQIRQSREAVHCWGSKDQLICDLFLWTPSYGRGRVGRPARTYLQQLCTDTGCSIEALPKRWTIGTCGERGSGKSYIHTHTYTYKPTYIHTYTCIYKHINTCTFLYTHEYTHTHKNTHKHTYTFT